MSNVIEKNRRFYELYVADLIHTGFAAYEDRIAYKPTLSEALEELFGEGYESNIPTEEQEAAANDPEGQKQDQPGALTQAELIDKANEAYENAVAAQQSGDWAAYGKYLSELEQYLKALDEM